MAFLDNSGDIILDAVLTDTGRYRLAKGDGSFKIVKYAFGDDEINYALYKNDNHALGQHASGSAYYDLDILQTPVLEAFTNNTSSMKSKLITIPRNNLTHLPIIKLNDTNIGNLDNEQPHATTAVFHVAVDKESEQRLGNVTDSRSYMWGFRPSQKKKPIRLEQGLDTQDFSPESGLDSDLMETQYIVEIDHRLGTIYSPNANPQQYAFLDDDFVASYYFTQGSDNDTVGKITGENANDSVIAGPRGTHLSFLIKASVNLQRTDFLFDKIGGGTASTISLTQYGTNEADGSPYSGTATFKYIDTNIRISGATTGYRIDVPVRFVKYTS